MPRVEIYVLPTADPEKLLRTACTIAEKAFAQSLRIYLHAASGAMARMLDQRLWTFRDRSFLPHALATDEAAAAQCPIRIGFAAEHVAPADLLLHLAEPAPEFFEEFTRVADLVDADPARRAAGRERYRFYVARGCTPKTHTLQP